MRKKISLLLLLFLTSNLLSEELLTIRVPVRTGSAPFTLQAHIFSRDPLAETITIELESDRFYQQTGPMNNQRLTEYRKERLGPGEYNLTVKIHGGPENKLLHIQTLGPIKVIGME